MKKIVNSVDREDKVKTGWYVSPKVKTAFVDFCNHAGCVTQDSCAGALLCWEYLSADIQRAAIRKANGEDIDLAAYFPEAIKPGSSRAEQVAGLLCELQRIVQSPQAPSPASLLSLPKVSKRGPKDA